jgi:hypothetical protein
LREKRDLRLHLDMRPCGGDQSRNELIVIAMFDAKKYLGLTER